jgi:hypothetical protein
LEIYGSSLAIAPANEVILEANEPWDPNDPENRFGRPRIGDVLSIHLSQQAGSVGVWIVTVFVQVAQGFYICGQPITTNPPSGITPDPPARTIGFAFIPGAMGWKVQCTCDTDGEIADIVLQSSKGGGGSVFGVTPNTFIPPGAPG